jgi:hypothetical protein
VEHFNKLIEEFKSRKTRLDFRNAVRMRGCVSSVNIVVSALAASLDNHMRRTGLRLESFELLAEKYDMGRGAGFGLHAKLKKSGEASLLFFVADRYEKMLAESVRERGEMVKLLEQVRRARTIHGVRKKISRRLGAR